MDSIEEKPTSRGARLVQHGAVLSEVLGQPGPTHSVVDVMAATALALATRPCPSLALLGFAAGGIIAPWRALQCPGPVDAVDLDLQGASVFHRRCGAWCGEVRVHQADAAAWLRRRPSSYDIIIEDLS